MDGVNPTMGLGRLPAVDARDHAYSMMTAVMEAEVVTRRYRYWYPNGWWGDQGATSQCVGYAWAHWVEDGPVGHAGVAPIAVPGVIYREAQLTDEWPGESYDGTSVRAGARVLQQMGLIEAYLWAFDVDTVVEALLTVGPVVVGTDWHQSMFYPGEDGVLHLDGAVVGGHAYVLNGVSLDKKRIRVKNSWGRSWARNGQAWIAISDMGDLIEQNGEACLAIEKP